MPEYELLQVSEKEMMWLIGDQISVEHPAYFCVTSAGTIRIHPAFNPDTMALRFKFKGVSTQVLEEPA